MKFAIESTRFTLISIASLILALSTSIPADAQGLKIGIVKHDLTSGVCFAYIPGSKKEMLIIPFTNKESQNATARMNINGENVLLKQTSLKVAGKVSKAKYKSQNVSLTVEFTTVEEREEPIYYSKMTQKISIKSKGITKNINTTGGCNG
jgi:hypothetical protein